MPNQREKGGLPSRRRRFMDTGDSGPYCMVLQNNEKNTGTIVHALVRACVCGSECVCAHARARVRQFMYACVHLRARFV